MNRLRARRQSKEYDNVERWLVSYADYMTLLFALFVVLYAMAVVNDEPFEAVTESIGRVFQENDQQPKNKGHGDDILPVNSSKTNKRLFGNGILDAKGQTLVDGEVSLSNVSDDQSGSTLTSLEKELNEALYELVEAGYAELTVDGDWLEIELSSGLLFPSGSSSPTNAAKEILTVIYKIIASSTNYIRIRGYTDNQTVDTEIFSSNWELSVFRASAVLRILEELTLDPARMAIEGYGQYYPNADNKTAKGRAQNRRVVIAISKYGIKKVDPPVIAVNDVKVNKEETKVRQIEDKIRVISLKNGGIRITTRREDVNSEKVKPEQ